jgi:hypothetical protein
VDIGSLVLFGSLSPQMSLQCPFTANDERIPILRGHLTEACALERLGVAAWMNGVYPSEIIHLTYSFPHAKSVLTADVHKSGHAPYRVVVHNEVVDFVRASYGGTPEQYWILAAQRRMHMVFVQNVANSL